MMKIQTSLFKQITPTEQANLRAIAASQTKTAFDAQAVLAVAYGEEYPILLPDLPYFVSPELIAQYAGQTINFKTNTNPTNYFSNVYPNPTSNLLYVDYQIQPEKSAMFILYDLNGKIVNNTKLMGKGQLQLSVDSIVAGIYYYQIVMDSNIVAANKVVVLTK